MRNCFQKKQISKKIIRSLIFLSIILGLLVSFKHIKGVQAQADRGLTVSPPALQFSLQPGTKTEKKIKITNPSGEDLEFFANVQDFIVTDKNGTPELLPPGTLVENRFAASTWAAVIPDSFIVPAGKSFTTTVYFQVPKNARPGGRYVAVAFKPTGAANPQNSGAAINTVVGSLVYLTVEGPIEENAHILQFSAPRLSEYGPVAFSTEIENLGDLHINPKANVEVKNLFGQKVYSFALDNLNIFPGASRIYKNSWEKKWLFGRFSASLTGYFGQNNDLPLTAAIAFWVIPYKLIAAVLLALAIAAVGYYYWKKNQEPQEIVEEPQKV